MNPVKQNPGSTDQPNQSVQAVEIQPDKQGMIPPQTNPETGAVVKDKSGKVVFDCNMVIPNMLLHYFPSGMLGLGLTALLASFMSGMAGNVTAFNTVWTYDIFKAYIRRDATDATLLLVGQLATFFGVALSVAVAYFVAAFNNIMECPAIGFCVCERAAFRNIFARDVLETRHRSWGVLRFSVRNIGRSCPSRTDHLRRRDTRCQRRLDRDGSRLSKSDGAEFLYCDLRLDRLLPCNDRDKPPDETAWRRRTERVGLCTD
jgi:hypothetical protein